MSTTIDIREKDLAIVRAIVQAILPAHAQVYVFGSRATGTLKRASDLDLAVDVGRPMTAAEILEFAEAFDDSDLPYRVDVVDMHTVDAGFKQIIERDRVRLP